MKDASAIFSTHMRYHVWATKEMWNSVRAVPPALVHQELGGSFGSIYSTLAHMFRADAVWSSRLKGDSSIRFDGISVPAALNDLEVLWLRMIVEDTQTIAGLDEQRFWATHSFTNSHGTRFETPLWQIILHLVNHGTGHRGQVNGLLRQSGISPTGTDLIQYYRQAPDIGIVA